eukprot:comp60916_c0_seq1/m.47877 comp60916_c0_seq1/g.47877  ORF comp60916_c0_seq1/g.47877 comp60916_c0_seq1/m.47877 type:complete len:241 (-) comp60916_c0_seq1:201-923(-)
MSGMHEEDCEGIDRENPWHASCPTKTKKLFSYNWAQGYVSPWRPTPDDVLDHVVNFLRKRTKESGYIIDLGCGDGRVLCRLAKELPYVRGLGVDLNDTLLTEAVICAAEMGVSDRVVFRHQDITATDTNGATVIICYLLPEALGLIRDTILLKALGRGALVVSVAWRIPGWGSEKLHLCEFRSSENRCNDDVLEMNGKPGEEEVGGSEGEMSTCLDAVYARMGFFCYVANPSDFLGSSLA